MYVQIEWQTSLIW